VGEMGVLKLIKIGVEGRGRRKGGREREVGGGGALLKGDEQRRGGVLDG